MLLSRITADPAGVQRVYEIRPPAGNGPRRRITTDAGGPRRLVEG
jgi:hypothetical protein